MEFTNLMLLHTVPLYWAPRPVFHAEKLREFLLCMLDPEKPGFVALGTRSPSSPRASNWLLGQEGIAWVEQTFSDFWHPDGLKIQQYGKKVNEPIFDHFVQRKAQLFMDSARFRECFQARVLPAAKEKESSEEVAWLEALLPEHGYYIGLSIDWAYAGNALVWTPQFWVSNFWPASPLLAPPTPSDVGSPPAIPVEQATDILENLFWKRIDSCVRLLREDFRLGEAGMWLESIELEPPVFYFAEPSSIPQAPEHYLESAPHLTALAQMCRVTLGTHDPKSSDVMGAFLEGNLFTLRREMVKPERSRSFYLVIPWWSTHREEWIEEVERELSFIADKLFFVEFASAFEVYDVDTDLAMPATAMALWGGTLDDAAEFARDLQRLAAFEPARSSQKQEAFKMVKQLRALLSRLEAEMLRVTDSVMRMERKWRASAESTVHFVTQALTARPLPGVRPLLDGIRDIAVYRLTGETARQAVQRASQMREMFDSVEKSLQDMLEQEQREERERHERNQRLLGYSVAVLAAVTAFPILIGQLNWGELQEVFQQWPKPIAWLGPILQRLHPYLVFVSTALAGTVSTLLLAMIVSAFLQPLWRRSSELEIYGKKLRQVWQLERGMPTVSRLRKRAFISHRTGTKESPELVTWRKEIDALDQQACTILSEVWQWLQKQKQGEDVDTGDAQSLWRKLRRFVIATELLDNRPTPFPFPVALCLFRYKSPDLVGSSVVSRFEFEQILNGYGFEDDEVRAIDQWVERELRTTDKYSQHELAQRGARLRDLPVGEFVQALREVVGVSALHAREILLSGQTEEEQLANLEFLKELAQYRREPDAKETGS